MKGLFDIVVSEEKLHGTFKTILRDPSYEPSRVMMEKVFKDYDDVDGNFVKDFQSTGFDARVWELYLFAYFREEYGAVGRPKPHPDFKVDVGGRPVFIEAVTSNDPAFRSEPYTGPPPILSEAEIEEQIRHTFPIRVGSPLFSKLKKRYWDAPHVSGHPLVFAVECFHERTSLIFGEKPLFALLFGQVGTWRYEGDKLIVGRQPIQTHELGTKKIPSGFFFQPETEHVSAVLFSNSGTLTKFFRMEVQDGEWTQPGRWRLPVVAVREGVCYSHPNAVDPDRFMYVVGAPEAPRESWGQGVSFIHNPRALHPIPEGAFPGAIHHRLRDDGNILTTGVPDFYPMASFTVMYKTHPSQVPDFSKESYAVRFYKPDGRK